VKILHTLGWRLSSHWADTIAGSKHTRTEKSPSSSTTSFKAQ